MPPPKAPRAVTSNPVWTLALDESGDFEKKQTHRVVGGVLLPGSPEQSAARLAPLRAWCEKHAQWPVHANQLSSDRRSELRAYAQQLVRDTGGFWLFVVADARDGREPAPSLGAYVRMLAATTDLAGRLVAQLGGKELHLRPAQRTIELDKAAEARGLVGRSQHIGKARTMSEAETRAALDALHREPAGALAALPQPGTVRVDAAAAYAGAHPGLALADIGCNALFRALESAQSLAQLLQSAEPYVVITLRATTQFRAIDRALRESPAALVRAADELARLESDALGAACNGGDSESLRQASYDAAELLWTRATDGLAHGGDANAIARALAAAAEAQLGARSGSYEGLARALARGWSGHDALATAQRSGVSDRTLAARLWRCTLECANHRGDLENGRAALQAFDEIVARGRSLTLLAEEFVVRNLAVVGMQNELPCEAEAAASTFAELERRTRELELSSERARALVSQFGSAPPAVPADPEREVALFRAAGFAADWRAPDRELAMSFGTIARSWAFLGRFDEALQAALRARLQFGDSAFDLTFNAGVIARIELERARRTPAEGRADVIAAALDRCGALALADAPQPPDFETHPGDRFTFDILLRALLWAPELKLPRPKVLNWLKAHALASRLSRGVLRSHPSELIARHAGELMFRDGARDASERWHRLSVDLCADHAPETTLGRIGAFSRRLLEGAGESGPYGSIANPPFEYR